MIPISVEYFTSLRRRPRPAPDTFARVPRRQFDAHIAALQRQRDMALGKVRAHADWVASYLEQRAASFREDAAFQERSGTQNPAVPGSTLTAKERRVVADVLTELAGDIERGPGA